MDKLKPDYYFNLSDFAHLELFDSTKPVWCALQMIGSYLSSPCLYAEPCTELEGAHFVNPETISIGSGTIVEPGAYIRGPCIIGRNCTIRHGAYLRGNVITGDDVVIGHATEVKNSILMNGAHAAHFNYVGDSILGCGVNLGAGVKLANLKIMKGTVVVRVDGKRTDSSLRKFGAILGDRVQLGCNSVSNPGTLMGPDAGCYPCVTISGFVDKGRVVKS
jgi:NDP-sugar pyrophosphorylase family protein